MSAAPLAGAPNYGGLFRYCDRAPTPGDVEDCHHCPLGVKNLGAY
jgi:hypothetical protein